MSRCSTLVLSVFCAFTAVAHAQVARADDDAKAHFDLPAESMDKALRELAIQANSNISYEPETVAGLRAPGIRGEFTIADALRKILAGTRLIAVSVDANTIHVQARGPSPSKASSSKLDSVHASGDVEAAKDAAVPESDQSSQSTQVLAADFDNQKNKDIQEITVTGTHIRGTKDSPSPVEIYTRDDIDATGMATVQQFLQTLPQNFNGGASENTIGSATGSGQTNNTVNGSAPNLRGLGPDATLVLVNGHRVAPGSSDGSFVDVSMIPLTAVERVEVVTDGASAIYGSDAIGGVVNFILRSNFDGAESRLQYGSVTSGAKHDIQVGQTVGDEWKNGGAVLSYQYYDQTPLSAGSRDYLHDVVLPFDLLPEQVQHSVFANLKQEIKPGFDLHGDLIYSHRSTDSVQTVGDPAYGYEVQEVPSRIDGYSATFGSTISTPGQGALNLSATYSESDTLQSFYQTPSATPLGYIQKTKSALTSVDANLDGVLASIPTGYIRYALGTQYRKESFGNTYVYPLTDNTFYPSRGVEAAYGELRIPLTGGGGDHGESTLEATLADRGEHYSDFGSTNNPQIGLIWKPLQDLTVRGTFGTSFKAPLLSQLNPVPTQVVALPSSYFNPGPGGPVNTLFVFGGNSDLKPEKATAWTAGLDFKPVDMPGFTGKMTYYDIVFKNQIISADASICPCNAFADAAFLGPAILQRNPPAALIQQLLSQPSYVDYYGIDPATIGAVFDGRSMNLSTVTTRGLDLRLQYKTDWMGSRFEVGVDGTYIFTFSDQFTSSAPVTSFRNTLYNPTDLRLRIRAILTRGPLSGGLYINFTNAYENPNVTPEEHVSSWLTLDAIASYEFPSANVLLHGDSLSVSIINLANRQPPYAANDNGFPINFDGANASVLGRYVSLRLQKRW